MFVAVIYAPQCANTKAEIPGLYTSRRSPSGDHPGMYDWSCFLGPDKDAVIQQALRARQSWESLGAYGPYQILVGELTESVKTPYTLEAYNG